MANTRTPNQALTADTITDKQIQDLRLSLARELADEGRLQASAKGWERAHAQYKLCDLALGRVRNYLRVKGGKRVARARLAEILNARVH